MKQKITMKDIASKHGLSINAVSLVLNNRAGVSEETRNLVLNSAEEMGYLEQSKKYAKTYSGKNIAVVIKRIYFNDMHFYSEILLGLEQEAKNNNYDVLMTVLDSKEIPKCVENRKVAGIFIVGKVDSDYLIMLKQYGIPVILVDSSSSTELTDSVMTDNKLGGFLASRYLMNKGFQKIGFFGDLGYTNNVRERFWGYQEAIKDMSGMEDYFEVSDYSKQYSVVTDIEQYVIKRDTNKIIERIKSVKQMPEVFFCSNDNVAFQVCNSLKIMGYHVPEDISVMGFDDLDLCTMVIPKLTTIHVNKELIGKRAFLLFIWRLEHLENPPEKIIIGTEVIERDSVLYH